MKSKSAGCPFPSMPTSSACLGMGNDLEMASPSSISEDVSSMPQSLVESLRRMSENDLSR